MGIIYNMCSGLALVSGHAEDRGRRSDRRVKAAENGRVWRRNTVEGGLVWVFWVVYLRYMVYRWLGVSWCVPFASASIGCPVVRLVECGVRSA